MYKKPEIKKTITVAAVKDKAVYSDAWGHKSNWNHKVSD